ncbi:MAG: hypothetical protein RTU92_04840 [Candidatus Thorarchaeota archaeon]
MSKKKKSKKLIRTRGMSLAVKLFKYSGLSLTPAKLVSTLKGIPYAPKKKKDMSSGFNKVKATGQVVVAEFVSGFRIPVLNYDAEGNLTPVHYVSVDRGEIHIKLDRGTVEVRGSERIARKFKNILETATGAKLVPLNLNGGAKKLYDSTADVASILLTGIEKPEGSLNSVQFSSTDDIKTEAEIGLYTRRYKGSISRFRGTFPYPSGAFHTTVVNADTGSLLIYRSGDGIPEKDVEWIVDLMESYAPKS